MCPAGFSQSQCTGIASSGAASAAVNPMQMVASGAATLRMGGGHPREPSALCTQFFCKLKNALEKSNLLLLFLGGKNRDSLGIIRISGNETQRAFRRESGWGFWSCRGRMGPVEGGPTASSVSLGPEPRTPGPAPAPARVTTGVWCSMVLAILHARSMAECSSSHIK